MTIRSARGDTDVKFVHSFNVLGAIFYRSGFEFRDPIESRSETLVLSLLLSFFCMCSESSNSGLSTTDLTDDILDADLILRRKDDLLVVILGYRTVRIRVKPVLYPGTRSSKFGWTRILSLPIPCSSTGTFNPVLSGTGTGAHRQHHHLAPVQ